MPQQISIFLLLIFAFYGLSFFTFGLVIFLLNDLKSVFRLSQALLFLAIFGILHGAQEWLDMIISVVTSSSSNIEIWQNLYLIFNFTSFYFLLCFSVLALVTIKLKNLKTIKLISSLLIVAMPLVGALVYSYCSNFHTFTDAVNFSRYIFAFPGALLAGVAFLMWKRQSEITYLHSNWVKTCFLLIGITFITYSISAGIIAYKGDYFPANIINKELFQAITGLPIQFFRMLCAIFASIFIFGILQIFIDENYKIRKDLDLDHEANFDPLTKLRNKRSLYTIIQNECSKATRYHRPLSLIFIDIDHFKSFNDQNGHDEGDYLLEQFAKVLSESKRLSDYTFRFGGDEFVLLLPEINADESKKFATRIQKLIKEHKFYLKNNSTQVNVSVSIGCTQYYNGVNINDFFTCADRAMYLAKKRGRDQVAYLDCR